MTEIVPFRVEVPEAELVDLRERLRRTRWPEAETVDDWSQGVPLAYLTDLCRHWAEAYDWRDCETRLNRLPHFRTTIDGLPIHFVHVRSPHPGALPLVLTHGWPGSILEFEEVIGPLTDPPAYGGAAADAFSLVLPSLPGFGFSGKPTAPGWGIARIADAWAVLMGRLGYPRFGASGGDWGSSVSTCLGQQHADRVVGLHLTPPLAAPDPATFADLTPAEHASLEALRHADRSEDGYSAEQSTKPQTIGYSLVDSPAGLAAWIVEKFRTWSGSSPLDGGPRGSSPLPDQERPPEAALDRDRMLDDITLYWLTRTGASAARLYWESIREVQEIFTSGTGDSVTVPTGGSIFAHENPRPSRRWAARRFIDIRYWNELDRGGHFAAWEQPELFVAEVRAFFRLVR
jgi:pimeloyl-ACP methyl ester carboxylesterase